MERQATSGKREASVRINDPHSHHRSQRGAAHSEPEGHSDNDGTESTATATTQETANLSRVATGTPLSNIAGGDTSCSLSPSSPMKNAPDSPGSLKASFPGSIPLNQQQQFKSGALVKANALQSSSDRTLHENSTQESKQPTVEENQSPEVASFPRSGSSCLKLLVSNNVAGSIIGKSGETILKLQRECGCRIKLSQAHDFFPGTSDRVCLLQGDNIDSVKKAVALILKKVRDVRELQLEVSALSEEDRPDPPTDSEDKTLFLTRILVPNPACGMIIGRAGTNIKAIASQTNSKIQMTQKEDMASVATSERVVTVTGSLHACTSCIGKLLDAMSIQPEVSQYANMTTSYKKNPSSAHGEQITTIPAQGLSPRFRPHTADALQPTPLYGLGGFSDLGVSTLSPRTTTLGPQHTISTVPPGYAPHVTTTGPYSAAASHTSFGRDSEGNILLLSSSRSFPTTDRSRLALQDGTFIQANATFGLTQLPVVTTSATISVQIGVPETMIGAILGRGGSGINDLQLCSGARIEVSQRGSFQPGTTNRIITLTGTEQACTTANFLINQRLSRQTTGFNSR